MQINGIQGQNAGAGQAKAAQAADSVSKNIRNQITALQNQMQELSANKEMGVEEKMKKRQELKQQIMELQNQLRQHEIEKRQEAKQESNVSMEDMLGGGRQEEAAEEEGVSVSFSDAGMQAMISAGSALGQAKVQGSVAKSLKGRAGILKTEIEQDASRGSSAEKKREELAAIEQRAMQASASQASSLNSAVHEMKEAAAGEAEEASGHQVNQAEGTKDESVSGAENISKNETDSALSMAERYNPIDIVL